MRNLTALVLSGIFAISGCSSNNKKDLDEPINLKPIKNYKYIRDEKGEVLNYPFVMGEVINDSIITFGGRYKYPSSPAEVILSPFGFPTYRPATASYYIDVIAEFNGQLRKIRFKNSGSAEKMKKIDDEINPKDKVKITFSPATPSYFEEIKKIQ